MSDHLFSVHGKIDDLMQLPDLTWELDVLVSPEDKAVIEQSVLGTGEGGRVAIHLEPAPGTFSVSWDDVVAFPLPVLNPVQVFDLRLLVGQWFVVSVALVQ